MSQELIFCIAIVYFIISIAMIVKFFQIASDIKDLKEKSCKENDSIDFLIANGYKVEAKIKLLRDVWNDPLMYHLKGKLTKEVFDLHYPKLREKYIKKFTRLGEDFPSYDNLIHK